MATLDLSLVTLTLRNLLDMNVRRLLGGIAPNALDVTTMPPEQVDTATQTLNLHLYHITEDPHFKNAVGMEMASPPISGQRMALRLYGVPPVSWTLSEIRRRVSKCREPDLPSFLRAASGSLVLSEMSNVFFPNTPCNSGGTRRP